MSYHPSNLNASDHGPAAARHSDLVLSEIDSNTSRVFGPYEPPAEGRQADPFLAKLRKQWDLLDPEMSGRIGLLEFGYSPEEVGVPLDGTNVYAAKLNQFVAAIELGKWAAFLLKTSGIVNRKRLLRIARNSKLIQEKTCRDMDYLRSTGVFLGVSQLGFDAAMEAQQSLLRQIPIRGDSGERTGSPQYSPRHSLSLLQQYLGQALKVIIREGQNPETMDFKPMVEELLNTTKARYNEHLRIESEAAKAIAARARAPKR